MFKRVLLAYDGSPEGAQALREGALLARTCCAQVYLLSVVPATTGVRMAEGVQGGVVAELTQSGKALLEDAAARLSELGFQPITRLQVGEPAQVIAAMANEIEANLVVVGHRRENFLSRWWSGSTGAYLSDHVGCSVLISTNPITDEDFAAEAQSAPAG